MIWYLQQCPFDLNSASSGFGSSVNVCRVGVSGFAHLTVRGGDYRVDGTTTKKGFEVSVVHVGVPQKM